MVENYIAQGSVPAEVRGMLQADKQVIAENTLLTFMRIGGVMREELLPLWKQGVTQISEQKLDKIRTYAFHLLDSKDLLMKLLPEVDSARIHA